VPAHTFSSGAATVCIPGTHLVGCLLRPALQTTGFLLLTQNYVLLLPILHVLCEIKWSHMVRDQVSKEAAASKTALNRASRCCSLRFLGTILAQIFFIPNSSVSIKRRVSQFMFTSSAIILTVNLQSDRTSFLTRAVLSPFRFVDCRPMRCSSTIRVLPSENILFQRKACALDTASSPKVWSFPCVAGALSPSLTHKKMQYCQYSYEKINLITLLSDYVQWLIQKWIEGGERTYWA